MIAARGDRRVAPGAAAPGFFTTFDVDETPIGSPWFHATTTWQKARTVGGIAIANAVNIDYDDSYALLSGSFGNDYEVEATIYRAPGYSPTNGHELELLLRGSEPDTTHVKAYECLFGMSGGSPYAQIIKWDGVMGSGYFTPIDTFSNPILGVSGDKLRARIVGSSISFYLVQSGVATLIASAGDSSHATGQPGMSFFMRSGGTLTSFGLTDYKVTPL